MVLSFKNVSFSYNTNENNLIFMKTKKVDNKRCNLQIYLKGKLMLWLAQQEEEKLIQRL